LVTVTGNCCPDVEEVTLELLSNDTHRKTHDHTLRLSRCGYIIYFKSRIDRNT